MAKTRKEVLDLARKQYGFIPNVLKEMSESPAVAQIYLQGQKFMADDVILCPNLGLIYSIKAGHVFVPIQKDVHKLVRVSRSLNIRRR